jgi:hypothetical protein
VTGRGVPVGVLAGVFLMALAVLTYEVALTRAFSVLLRYHFVFLAVSLATCGLGIGGLLDFLVLRKSLRPGEPGIAPSLLAAAAAIAFVGSISLLFSTSLSAWLTSLAVVGGICILPFIAAGAFMSHLFAAYSAQGGRLYFYDLTGAALGSCVVIIALQLTGATNVPLLCGMLAALAGAAVARAWAPRAAGVALAGLMAGGLAYNLRARVIDLPTVPPGADPSAKPLFRELGDPRIKAKIVHTEWNAFARTDVVAYARANGEYAPSDDLFIYTDGEVPTNMIHFDGDLSEVASRYGRFIGFFPFRTGRPRSVLLIGPGGGIDVLLALAVGAEKIEGAELNPSMLPIVRRFRDFAGPVYDYANVDVRVEEGRSYVRRSDGQYDLIYMALTKTATTAASSLALVESYVHTVEGFRDYLAHLSDKGQVAMVCQHSLVLMRLFLTGLAALRAEGMSTENALQHLAAVSVPRASYAEGPYRHMLIVHRRPLSKVRAHLLAKEAIGLGLVPAFVPGAYEPEPFDWLREQGMGLDEFARRFDGWWRGAEVNVGPCTDDRPFVIDLTWGIAPRFRNFALAIVGAVVVFSGVTVWQLGRSRPITATGPGPVDSGSAGVGVLTGAVVYFALLGAGYMLVEVCLAQKLILYLGYPALTLSVILFSLLVGSGLGSLFSQRWPGTTMLRSAALAALVVCVGVVALLATLPAMLSGTLGWAIQARCLTAAAILAPLGFAMGMPFPTGLREVGGWEAGIVPWAWGVNGVTSVLGSVLAMLAAKLYGFQTVLLGGAAVYAAIFALASAAYAHRHYMPGRG